jgi:hypothetical protein
VECEVGFVVVGGVTYYYKDVIPDAMSTRLFADPYQL